MRGKFWASAIVVTVLYFVLGWIFYGLLLKDWFATQGGAMQGEPNIALIALATFAYAVLMAYTYPIGYKGGSAGSEGMRFGILFALIINLPSMLFMMAMVSYTFAAFVVGLVWEIIVGAFLGFVTAKIYGGTTKAAAPASA